MKRTVHCLLLVLTAVFVFAGNSFARDNNESGVRVIVIDAGHGGKAFPGAVYGGAVSELVYNNRRREGEGH